MWMRARSATGSPAGGARRRRPAADPIFLTRIRNREQGRHGSGLFEVLFSGQGGTSMARGTVKYFNDQKGYGFITPEGQEGSEVYVHFSAIESGGFRTLREGESVEFQMVSSTRGNEAAHVLKV